VKRMRIMQVTANLGQGGGQRMMYNLTAQLRSRGFEVAAVSLYGPQGWQLEERLAKEKIPVWYLGKRRGTDLRMPSRIRDAVRFFRPDIVHTHLCLHYVFPSLSGRRPLGHVHSDHSTLEYDRRSKHWRVMRWLHRLAYRSGVVPIAVSREIAEKLARFYGVPDCRVIPNGIPTADYCRSDTMRYTLRSELGFQKDDVLFVCVARLAYLKNHAMLLEAFSRGLSASQRAHLLLAGEGELMQPLETKVRELRLLGKVHFLGLRGDVRGVLSAADVFVLASRSEGHPLALMEAMAAGLPCVGTDVGGVPELIEDQVTGVLVKAGDCHGMAAAMVRLLDNPTERLTMAQAAKQRAQEHFSSARMTDAYVQVYEQIIAKQLSVRLERGKAVTAHSH
jgi:glycosyltransferase involved in cell wall biosynthesis